METEQWWESEPALPRCFWERLMVTCSSYAKASRNLHVMPTLSSEKEETLSPLEDP